MKFYRASHCNKLVILGLFLFSSCTGIFPYKEDLSDTHEFPTAKSDSKGKFAASTVTPMMANSATPPIIIIPTYTPLPTIAPTDADALVLELVKDNGGCDLPCWWGITPGKTEWEETRQHLVSFVHAVPEGKTEIIQENGVFHTYQVHSVEYVIPGYFVIDDQPGLNIARVETIDGVVNFIEATTVGNEIDYLLPNFLVDYGKPDEILISFQETYVGEILISLWMYYPENGVIAGFSTFGVEFEKSVPACFYGPTGLHLWSQHKPRPIEDILNSTSDYSPLEDKTGISIDEFYQALLNSSEPCYTFPYENME